MEIVSLSEAKRKRPTIMDVARESGVSYQTVSRVVNQHPHVATETREAVQAAIDALGYQPNKSAAHLASKQTRIIAVVMYGANYFGPSQMALGIEEAATQAGYDVIFSHIANTHDALLTAVQNLNGWRVDGILMIAPVEGLTYNEIRSIAPQTPIVQIDGSRDPNIPSVVIDDAAGMQAVLDHLIDLGHSRFVEIAGPQDWFSAQVRHQTMQGVEPIISIEGDWTAASAYEATRALPENGFSAVVAANDQMALGVLRALQERGMNVPRDVSVVGYDDIPEAPYYSPPLTTIRQAFNEMGVVGIEYLLQLVEDPETPIQQHKITPTLITRQSSSSRN
jgi:LacI family transcriptional regulator